MAFWQPEFTYAECNAILTAPGQIHETELTFIDGRVLRTYKNVEPSLRDFWLKRVELFCDREYVVFDQERLTYRQVHERADRVASALRDDYDVHKGDRVAIAMRNIPEWLVTFWALALLGGIPVCINVWGTDEALRHCMTKANCKVALLDAERAVRFQPMISDIRARTCLSSCIIARGYEGTGIPEGMVPWDIAFDTSYLSPKSWKKEPDCALDDDGIIFFTSGTTSLPKAVLSTPRAFLQNMLSMSYFAMQSSLRNTGRIPSPPSTADPPKVQLAVAPFFHVAGCTGILMTTTSGGGKLILMRKWNLEQGLELIDREKITSTGGVPVVTIDLLRSRLPGSPASDRLKQISMGAAPMPPTMPAAIKKGFKNALFMQLYGLTETNLNATGLAGEDQIANPTSCGLPAPICDILIVDDTHKVMKAGEIGEVWIRGSNIMRCYYDDPEATKKIITPDGWFTTGDIGFLDDRGLLYIKDRAKDMIIRGGENIHCTTIENALLSHPDVVDVGAVGVPEDRLGELPAVVCTLAPTAYASGRASEAKLTEWARKTLPAMAVPVMIIIGRGRLERNATGKILKDKLRLGAKEEWVKRQEAAKTLTSRARL